MAETPLSVAQDRLSNATDEIVRATSDLARLQSDLARAQADLAAAKDAIAATQDHTGRNGPANAGGPHVTGATLDRAARNVTMTVDKPLAQATATVHAFAVSMLTTDGWHLMAIAAAELSADALSVAITLGDDPGSNRVRFIAYGTGPAPLLGAEGVPLAGRAGSAGSTDDGQDYVQMFT